MHTDHSGGRNCRNGDGHASARKTSYRASRCGSEAAGTRKGIHLCCLSEFCIEEQKRYEHMLVLNYSGMEEERMQEVAELLGGVFDSEIAEKRE